MNIYLLLYFFLLWILVTVYIGTEHFPIDRHPCDGILCVHLFCSPGEVLFIPEGECCPICVPSEQACASLECERQEKKCKVFFQHVECVSTEPRSASAQATNPCAVAHCIAGTVCEEIGGKAVCVPQFPTQECSFPMQCEPGTVCRVIGGNF